MRSAPRRGRVAEPASRAREDLPRVRLALVDRLRDLVEPEIEHLSQQKHRALGRRELLEQHQKRHGQRRCELGGFLIRFSQRFGQPGSRILHPRPLGAAQVVDAEPRDDGREIRANGANFGLVVLARPEPRVLHDILGLAGAAEHPVRNREQQRSMRLECCPVPVNRGHKLPFWRSSFI
jgi:hypothetical protein